MRVFLFIDLGTWSAPACPSLSLPPVNASLPLTAVSLNAPLPVAVGVPRVPSSSRWLTAGVSAAASCRLAVSLVCSRGLLLGVVTNSTRTPRVTARAPHVLRSGPSPFTEGCPGSLGRPARPSVPWRSRAVCASVSPTPACLNRGVRALVHVTQSTQSSFVMRDWLVLFSGLLGSSGLWALLTRLQPVLTPRSFWPQPFAHSLAGSFIHLEITF